MNFIRQATSIDVPIGPFLDSTDGNTQETGLTITQPDVRLKKNGGAWAQKAAAQTLTHEEAGWYEVTLDATDTDTVGHLIVAVHESGGLAVWREFQVVEEAVYDALFAASAPGYLQPTTAGRTLDVTATGAAGIDFGNVENQSTSVNLSGTSVGTVASVTAIDTGGIVAGSFAADAITAAKIAADVGAEIADAVWDEARSGHTTQGTFGEVNQSVRSFTAQGGGTNTITLDASASAVDDFYNGSIAWLLKNTGAGQAGVITDYNGTTKVATVDNNWRTNPDATTEGVLLPGSLGLTSATLASAVWDAATATYATAGTFGLAVSDTLADTTVIGTPAGASIAADIATVDTVVDAILVDTGTTLDGRIPAALVGGRMDANVGAISADSVAADNAEAFFDGTGYAGTGNVIPTVTTVTGGALSTEVDALEAAVIAIEADTQDIQSRLPAALTAGGNIKADALAVSGDTVAADNLEAAADGTGYNLGGGSVVAASVTGAVGSVTGNVGGNVVGSVASVTGAVGSVTAGVTLAASAVQAIWDAATSALTTVGSIGKRLVDYLTGDIYARLGAPAGASTAADIAAIKAETASILTDTAEIGTAGAGLTNINLPDQTMDIVGNITGNLSGSVGSVTGAVGSVTGNVGGNVTGNLGGTLTSTERNAIADALLNRGLDGAGASSRKVREALAFMRNKWAISGSTLTVYDVDDTTALFTATITSASGNPVTSVDPA